MKNIVTHSLAVLLLAANCGHAESVYSEQDKLLRGGRAVTTLGADLFGDKVSLYNGTLEFTQTDVSLPGNNALPVSVGRRLVPGGLARVPGAFSDWDLDIPHLHGIFSGAGPFGGVTTPWTTQAGGTARCTTYGVPPVVSSSQSLASWNPDEYWHGSFMYLPGAGSQEILSRAGTSNTNFPSAGDSSASPWPLTTRSMWSLRCLTTPMARGEGEGFVALTPDGTQYKFDWLVSRSYPSISKPGTSAVPVVAPVTAAALGGSTSSVTVGGANAGDSNVTPTVAAGENLSRQEVWILPTLVTDRHGNTVTYTYDSINPWQLRSIVSSDGRAITLNYGNNGFVATVSDGTRSWGYSYGNSGTLYSITQPDGAAWQFSMDAFTAGQSMYLTPPDCEAEGSVNTLLDTGTMTHPSGAVGTFSIRPTTHSRSFVEKACRGDAADGTWATFPRYIASKSLISKTISGPGLPSMSWSYAYSPAAGTASWLGCTGTCPESKTVEVTDPRSVLTRYTFGNRYKVTEGQLQKIEVGPVGSAPLRTTTMRYRAPDAGPYASYIGISPQRRGDADLSSRNAPQDRRVITQQGVSFTWEATGLASFDDMARPKQITRSGSPGISRTEITAYADNTSKWVIGQILSVTESDTGKAMIKNEYDSVSANLMGTSKFPEPSDLHQQRFTYYADGTLKTRVDRLNQTTTFSSYMRGLAQSVLYADGTSESAVINNLGLITSVTDAMAYTTNYHYDAMGRLDRITRPAGDPVAWNDTTLTFERVFSSEYDLPAGHWRQTVATGNARTISYFDGLWRARMTKTFDSTDEANTRSMVLRNFDVDGRTVYESYPARSIQSVNAVPVGSTTQYDALGRVTVRSADSELGATPITSYSYYDTNLQTRLVNPRGFTTTTTYQALDQPDEASISAISAPEGVNVAITRDVFRKPLSITRSGTGGGFSVSATRSYFYDPSERLCKTVEPETGATIQAYDAADRVAWRASGLALTGTSACDTASVAAASKTSFGYDARNRLTSTSFGDGSPGITRTYYADGLPQTVVSNGSTWTSSYNRRRLLTQEKLSYAGQDYVLGWTYNANGHPAQLTYPDAKSVNTNPNALGQARQVESYASAISYHPNGAVAGFTYGNGITHTLTQNTRGLPAMSRDTGILQDSYSYDANANVTGIADGTANNTGRSMSYDALDRLLGVSAPGMWGTASYTYDPLDNIRTSTVGSRSNLHNYDPAKNRLTSIASNVSAFNLSYAYDIQGNITQRGAQAFSFDQGNRLSSATGKASYVYDGLGHRVKVNSADGTSLLQIYSPAGQLLYTKQSGGPSAAKNTRYIYLNRHLIAEAAQ